ncbi:unnamed protein product [Closterium sp. NIES-53]
MAVARVAAALLMFAAAAAVAAGEGPVASGALARARVGELAGVRRRNGSGGEARDDRGWRVGGNDDAWRGYEVETGTRGDVVSDRVIGGLLDGADNDGGESDGGDSDGGDGESESADGDDVGGWLSGRQSQQAARGGDEKGTRQRSPRGARWEGQGEQKREGRWEAKWGREVADTRRASVRGEARRQGEGTRGTGGRRRLADGQGSEGGGGNHVSSDGHEGMHVGARGGMAGPGVWVDGVKRHTRRAGDRCWSQWEMRMYVTRPDRQLPPSMALRRRLSEYRRMHRRCTQIHDWHAFYSNPSTGWKDGIEGLGNCKYLFYMPPARHGVGNRIMALISAFSYALLTNRTLIIPPDSFLFQFFCEPFPGSSWTIPLDAFK